MGLAQVEVMNLAASPPPSFRITSVLTLESNTGLASPAAATTGLGTFEQFRIGVRAARCCGELLTEPTLFTDRS